MSSLDEAFLKWESQFIKGLLQYNAVRAMKITREFTITDVPLPEPNESIRILTKRTLIHHQLGQRQVEALCGFPPASDDEVLKYGTLSLMFLELLDYWFSVYPTFLYKALPRYFVWCIKQYEHIRANPDDTRDIICYRYPCFSSFSEWHDKFEYDYMD